MVASLAGRWCDTGEVAPIGAHRGDRNGNGPRQDGEMSSSDLASGSSAGAPPRQRSLRSPAPGSRPTRASPTSVARTGCGPRTPQAEKAATLQHYLADPEVRRIAWQNRLHSPAWDAQPNAGHLAIVASWSAGAAGGGGHPEHRRIAPARRAPTRAGDRGARHDAVDVAAGRAATAGRWSRCSSECAPGRTTRRACVCDEASSGVEERHDLVRSGAGARGDRRRDAGRGGAATCCWPPARRCRCSRRPTWCPGPGRRRARWSSSTASRPAWIAIADVVLHRAARELLPALVEP